ncbi:hypothetical protein QBC35DRAFT_488087 [Podospora australis]|uniref:Uncharacterized protein n=1 Tax=Podospora australis TaxID=1536484 RepID=A0AAN6X0J0_9PEZI|nr:hypothetical protein QBC35DRAFT_488087 [Podospora australis]
MVAFSTFCAVIIRSADGSEVGSPPIGSTARNDITTREKPRSRPKKLVFHLEPPSNTLPSTLISNNIENNDTYFLYPRTPHCISQSVQHSDLTKMLRSPQNLRAASAIRVSSIASQNSTALGLPYSTSSNATAGQGGEAQKTSSASNAAPPPSAEQRKKKKTLAELDEELKQKMEGLAGDGGESGVEYENGKPVAMKRSVKDNMFRYI